MCLWELLCKSDHIKNMKIIKTVNHLEGKDNTSFILFNKDQQNFNTLNLKHKVA